MQIILDERETSLYDKCLLIKKDVEISKKVIPLGDILIEHENKPFILVERKSLQDLLSSIKDGRYEEQSHRLQHSDEFSPDRIIYLIEGMFSQLSRPGDKQMIHSAMTSLSIFKGFRVIRTCSMQETAEWLIHMVDKIDRNLKKGIAPFLSTDIVEPVPYCTVVKKVKKENITPENMGEIILCQIPGISSISAVAIMNSVGSLVKLIEILQNNPSELEKIHIQERKISKTILQNRHKYLILP